MDGPKKLVGHAVADAGRREYLILATKVGLEWNPEKTRVRRNASYARISQEIEKPPAAPHGLY